MTLNPFRAKREGEYSPAMRLWLAIRGRVKHGIPVATGLRMTDGWRPAERNSVRDDGTAK